MTDSDWEPHVDRRARKPKRKAKNHTKSSPEERQQDKLRRRMIEQLRNYKVVDDEEDESEFL